MTAHASSSPSAGWRPIAGVAARWLLAAVFLAAGLPKALHPHGFAESIYRYHLLDYAWINIQAVFMPWLELVCAVTLLVWPRFRKGALLLIALMLVLFTTAIAINVHRGVNIDCGCFSVSHQGSRIGWLNLVRNAAFLALTVIAWRWSARRGTAPAEATPPPPAQ